MDLQSAANRRVVELTTRGRKSGQSRTVKIWFVVAGPSTIYVQHASRAPAHWYRNLLQNPAVTVDFGNGPLSAHAAAIKDADGVRRVLRLVRRKYAMAWIVQLLGWGKQAVAAEIHVGD